VVQLSRVWRQLCKLKVRRMARTDPTVVAPPQPFELGINLHTRKDRLLSTLMAPIDTGVCSHDRCWVLVATPAQMLGANAPDHFPVFNTLARVAFNQEPTYVIQKKVGRELVFTLCLAPGVQLDSSRWRPA
jgi:hypothetical protein